MIWWNTTCTSPKNAGIEIADRFLVSAEKSFGDLSLHRGMGAPLTLGSPKLAGLRKWQVDGFAKMLIFYLPREGGASIVRVLHAAQDWWSLLGILDRWAVDSQIAEAIEHLRKAHKAMVIARRLDWPTDADYDAA